jgi:ParG
VSEDAKDPAALLVQAVGTLPPEDRDAVLAWLLRRDARRLGIAALGQAGLGSRAVSQARMMGDFLTAQTLATVRSPQGAQQVVPVRFPTEQHAQLREWCAEHGFSMATVIRGLVTRFLDMQLPERN